MEDPVQLVMEEVKHINEDETQTGKLSRKLKENPFLGVGLVGMVGACTYGGYLYKKGQVRMPLPQYLMQLRVAAQGTVVASLVAGVAYTMYKHLSSQQTEHRKM